MKTYHPQCRVILLKTVRRTEIVPGLSAVRDRYADVRGIDLTPHLGEAGGVHVSKSVREPAGDFSITLADKSALLESLYALVEPMDMVEIRMARSPHEYWADGSIPVVMRGLVSTVQRGESMAGGKPTRTVTIAGKDFGKILEIFQIHYLNNSKVGDNIINAWAYFQRYAPGRDAILKPAGMFLAETLHDLINKFLARMSALSDGVIGNDYVHVVKEWKPSFNIAGIVSPYTINSMVNVTLYQMLATVLDVGAFNELYTEDRDDGVYLVARPNPFKQAGTGQYIQQLGGVGVETVTVSSDEIEAINVSRSDAGTANYYWVMDPRWTMTLNQSQNELAIMGGPETLLLDDYLNSADEYYGFRKMEVQTNLGPPGFLNSMATTKEDLPAQTQIMADWLIERRRILAESNKDNVAFESGTMRIRGNEKVRAGMYVDLQRGQKNTYCGEYYAYRVDHEFLPFRGFFTSLTVDRGTGFITRASQKQPQYLAELDGRGIQ